LITGAVDMGTGSGIRPNGVPTLTVHRVALVE
jgi:hypothetical protein